MNRGYNTASYFSIRSTRHSEGQGQRWFFSISLPDEGADHCNAPREDRCPPGRHRKLEESLKECRQGEKKQGPGQLDPDGELCHKTSSLGMQSSQHPPTG